MYKPPANRIVGNGSVSAATARPTLRILAWAGLILVLCSAVLTGCTSVGSGPGKQGAAEDGGTFTVEEGASIDSGARADFEAAMVLLEAEEYERGVQLLESVVKRAPKAIAPYVNLAISYRKLDKPDTAQERLQQALAINPRHPVANNEYGMLLRKEGRFSEAKGFYEKALGAYPDFHPARKNLGILCDLYMNDPHCALSHYEAYAQAVPGDETVQLWIVDLKRRVGE